MAKYDYDLITIGGGAAGLTASGVGANFGAKVLMIERHRLGGDCTWTGCVPSKTLLKAAKVAQTLRHASRYGLTDHPVEIDFGRVMAHVRTVRQDVYHDADRPEIFEDMGIDVRHGQARFIDAHTIALEAEDGTSARITGRYFIIAAGASAMVPPIDGLDGVPYLTNESLFEIEAQPQHLAIIGAGPIGTEMAQAFARLGTDVTVLDRDDRILGNDDPELAGMLRAHLEAEGIHYLLGANISRASHQDSTMRLTMKAGGQDRTIAADALLVATGRRPNLDGLGLENAGIAFGKRGITVDDRCRTNVRHIYAVGDVTGRYQFTHMSEHMAKVAVTNALLKLPMKIDDAHVPWVTYTEPELAHVGATQQQLDDAGTSYQVYRFPYSKVDRAITEGETTGLIKVYATRLRGKILGASVLGVAAGELICEYAVAMRNGVSLRQVADTIHPYPTYGLGARRAADQWYIRNQSATFVKVVKKVFGYRGSVHTYGPGEVV